MSDLTVGEVVEVDCGPIAHGGHVVARHEGRVLFVRHALPGERVRARVTEGEPGARFVRADAVAVLQASADRVEPACPYAGPGLCGGCDFQHVALSAQRRLKTDVVREQFAHLARIDLPPTFAVEPVPGDADGLGWRTRIEWAVAPDGSTGLRRHRSHEVIPIEACLIAHPRIGESPGSVAGPLEAIDTVVSSTGQVVEVGVPVATDVPQLTEHVAGHRFSGDFEVSARGFWQVHPGAATTFVDTVLELLEPRAGERCLDLYAGVGLFGAALGGAVGHAGSVVAIESDSAACESATRNLAGHPATVVIPARVDDAFGVRRRTKGPRRQNRGSGKVRRHPLVPPSADLVVLDPPRTGAGRDVLAAVAALGPRAMAYVACDPAALARDVAYLADVGYRMEALRAFDAFPMTHHVECVALFVPTST